MRIKQEIKNNESEEGSKGQVASISPKGNQSKLREEKIQEKQQSSPEQLIDKDVKVDDNVSKGDEDENQPVQ